MNELREAAQRLVDAVTVYLKARAAGEAADDWADGLADGNDEDADLEAERDAVRANRALRTADNCLKKSNAELRAALAAPHAPHKMIADHCENCGMSGASISFTGQTTCRGAPRAPEGPPSGPWRVAQNAGARPQPRFVEYWEGPLPEQYGARWEPNGFPSAEEAQVVCDALNALSQRKRDAK